MAKRSRRQFLEDSMYATAAAVASTSATSLVAQADEQPTNAGETLNVAVIGTRGRGQSHIKAFLGRKDTRISYVCDVDKKIGFQRAGEIAKRQGGAAPKFVSDMREVFDDKSVDIVTVATPNHWHSLAAIWAVQAGKDVYLEKPVSHNVSEGRRVVEAARKYKKIVQTGTQSRSNPGMQEAMKFVQDGGIGEVRLARGLCYKRRNSIGERGKYDPPRSVDYDTWLGPAPKTDLSRKQFHYDWHWQWPYGNGDLGNQGIHQMDLARWGLGLDKLSKRIISYGGRFGYEDAGDTANTQVVVHDYETKTLVFEVRGLNTDGYKNSKVGVIFEGSEGYVVMTSYFSGAAFDLDGKKIKSFNGQADHYANFMGAVRSRKHEDLNADIVEGHLSSALCHTGNISYRMGKEMSRSDAAKEIAGVMSNDNMSETLERTMQHLKKNSVDLDKINIRVGAALDFNQDSETFVDNAAADEMLTRKYRAPFVVPKQGEV